MEFEPSKQNDDMPEAVPRDAMESAEDVSQEAGPCSEAEPPVAEQVVDAEIMIINESTTDSVVDAEIVGESAPAAAAEPVVITDSDTGADKIGAPAASQSVIPDRVKPPVHWQKNPQSQLARESIASVGGAVGSIVLGTLAIFGALISSLAIINAVLGFILAVWGMSSPRKKLAGIGMGLCALGLIVPICLSALSANLATTPEVFTSEDGNPANELIVSDNVDEF